MNIQTALARRISELHLAKNTVRSYENGLKRFTEFLQENGIYPDQDVSLLSIDHFIFFLGWLDGRYSKQTANLYSVASKSFLNWLVIANVIQLNYVDTVRFDMASRQAHRRHEDKLPRWPKRDDIDKMLEAVHTHPDFTPKRQRDVALLEMLASTGCRVSELVALNVQDIDLENHSTIVVGKGNKERRVFFSQAACEALGYYWTARNSRMPSDPVFARHDLGAGKKKMKRITTATVRNIVNQIAEFAGLDVSKMSPHYFRHAFAIRVLSETGNLALAQDLLGHRDPKSTRVYAKIYADDLKEAHRSVFG